MPIKKVRDAFKDWLGRRKDVQAPPEVRAKFLLTYNDMLVGTLTVKDGIWEFAYSEEFKQSDMRPIVEFPKVDETYQSNGLWQFFAMRIPSPEQAEVEAIIREEHIEENDAVELLKRFGGRTIANPFELSLAA